MAIQSTISNKEGSVEIFEGHPMNSGNCGVHKNFESSNGIQVNSVLLLNQIPKMKFPPRIIKIDTEGSEDKILSQLGKLIKMLPEDIEFNLELIGMKKANDILVQFLDFGFNAFAMKNSYDIEFYLKPNKTAPLLFKGPIGKQIDILFTNKTAETLKSGS